MVTPYQIGDKVMIAPDANFDDEAKKSIYRIVNKRYSSMSDKWIFRVEDIDDPDNWREVYETSIYLYPKPKPKFEVDQLVTLTSDSLLYAEDTKDTIWLIRKVEDGAAFGNLYNYVITDGVEQHNVMERSLQEFMPETEFNRGDIVRMNDSCIFYSASTRDKDFKVIDIVENDRITNTIQYKIECGAANYIVKGTSIDLVKNKPAITTMVVAVRKNYHSEEEFYDYSTIREDLTRCKNAVYVKAKSESTWHVHNPVVRFETIEITTVTTYSIWSSGKQQSVEFTSYDEALKVAEEQALKCFGVTQVVKNSTGQELDRITIEKKHVKVDP